MAELQHTKTGWVWVGTGGSFQSEYMVVLGLESVVDFIGIRT
jgi:hypothetical protein